MLTKLCLFYNFLKITRSSTFVKTDIFPITKTENRVYFESKNILKKVEIQITFSKSINNILKFENV